MNILQLTLVILQIALAILQIINNRPKR